MKTVKTILAAVAAIAFAGAVIPGAVAAERKAVAAPEGHPLKEIISGYEYRTKETQALQDDDFANPGFLWVERGQEIWNTADGEAGKSCADCHGDAAESMKMVGVTFPKWNEGAGKPVNIEGQINICREQNMKAAPYKFDHEDQKALTTFLRSQARGLPVNVAVDGQMQPWFEKGKELYYTRMGQLDLACASCHEQNYGNNLRSDLLSQGQTNGFPTYRLKSQGIVSLHNRFKGCIRDVRAVPYDPMSDELMALEVYVAWRGQGLLVEAPAIRQ